MSAILTTHRAMSATDRTRLVDLRAQLDEVHADLALAKRLPYPGGWLHELRREQRGLWDQLADLATTP